MKNSFKVGDFVQSRYRAQWKGTIVELSVYGDKDIVWVRQEIDRHGRPMRKQKWMSLNVGWLKKIERDAPQA